METQTNSHSKPPSPGASQAGPQQSPRLPANKQEMNMQRANEEMRQHIAKLKSELEAEKARYKQLHRDKIADQKQLRDSFEVEKERALMSAQSKQQHDKSVELQRLKETLNKERDAEIRQMLKTRDEEIKQLKSQSSQEKDDSIKVALELQRQAMGKHSDNILSTARPGSGNSLLVVKLQREIKMLKDSKKAMEEKYEEKCRENTEKDTEIDSIKKHHQQKIMEVKSSISSEALGKELGDELKRADQALETKLMEIQQQAGMVQKLRQDKEDLEKKLHEISAQQESQIHQQSQIIDSLQKDNEVLSSHVKDLASQVEDNKIRNEVLDKSKDEEMVLQSKLDASERLLAEVTKDHYETVNQLKQQNDNLEQQLQQREQVERQLSEQANLSQKLSEENQNLTAQLSELQNKKSDFEEQASVIEKLQSQMEELEVRLKADTPQLHDINANLHSREGGEVHLTEPSHVGDAKVVLSGSQGALTEKLDTGTGDVENQPPDIQQRGVEEHEKERQLQKRVSDLNNQVGRLEKKVNLLKQENDTLKKKAEEQKSSDEKIKKLKKRNAELAGIARRLEDKAKQLQQESAKRTQTTSPGTANEAEHVKKNFAKQRAKDLAVHAQTVLSKDKEIESLRHKCQELTSKLRSDHNGQLKDGYSESEEFETIIKQAAREKLRLEKQLSQRPEGENESEIKKKIEELQNSNQQLLAQLDIMKDTSQQAELLEVQLSERQSDCESLQEQMNKSSSRIKLLEGECENEAERSGQLEAHCARLQAQLGQLQQVNNECEDLRKRLASSQTNYDASQVEAASLRGKISSIQTELERLSRVEQEKKRLQNEHQTTLEQLHHQQQQIEMLSKARMAEEEEHEGALTDLQLKLLELEQKYKLQAMKHDELTMEMDDLRRKAMAAGSPTSASSRMLPVTGSAFSPSTPPSASPNANANNLAAEIAARMSGSDGKQGRNEGEIEPDSFYKKTPFQVFVAKYSYDPTKFSPNENPDAELVLNAGDYIFVYGPMDEDGFYEGELMDGSHGLLPSNFVEKVPDEELEQFHANLAMTQRDENQSVTTSVHADLMELHDGDEESDLSVGHSVPPHGALHENSLLDDHFTDSLLSFDLDLVNKHEVPFPVNLQLDRQLTNSIVISWDPPADMKAASIQSYHVYVDNEFKTSVRAQERTKALLEGIDTTKTHRVCVRTVTDDGQSRDPQCTMLVGKDISHAPSGLRVSGVTGTEAMLAWLPANSNLHHAIAVNSGETRWLSPGIYKYKITGLTHASEQEVTVRAHNPLLSSDTNQKASLRFKTTMEVRPDPPLDVQVEVGPKEGTLLVTWLPVTLRASGTSNGAPVEGYRIYVDDKLLTQITGANDDHLILDTKEFNSLPEPQVLFLRTLAAGTGLESPDSNVVALTSGQILQEIKQSLAAAEAQAAAAKALSVVIKPVTAAPVKTSTPVKKVVAKGPEEEELAATVVTNAAEGLDVSGDISAELSDIAEVDEDEEVNKIKGVLHAIPKLAKSPTPTHKHNVPVLGGSPVSERPLKGMSPSTHNGPASSYNNQAIVQPRVIGPQGGVVESRRSPTQIGFQPIREGGVAVNQSEMSSPKGQYDSKDNHNNMQVPQIEITKDSSGSGDISASGPENFSDDDAQSSTSGAMSSQPSPVSPVRQFYDGPGSSRFKPLDKSHGYQGDAVSSPRSKDQKDSRPSSGKQPGNKSYATNAGRLSPEQQKPRGRHAMVSPNPKSASHSRDYFDNGYQSPQNTDLSLRSNPSYQELLDNNVIVPNKIRDDIPDSDLIDYEDDGGESLIESVELEYDDSRVRIFIALFDYDPMTMSPNPDAADEELPFKEGQLIKIYGDKDGDGFYMGESGGRRGLVPCNMVSEVQVDDPDIAAQLLRDSNRSASQASRSASAALRSATQTPASRGTTPRVQGGTTPRHSKSGRSPHHEGLREGSPGDQRRLSGGRRMKALYNYNPVELSPNVDAEEELPFIEGDIVTVYGDMDEDGFFYGECKGRYGLVPSNFLEELPKSATTPRSTSGSGGRDQRTPYRSRTPQEHERGERVRGDVGRQERGRGDTDRTMMAHNGKGGGKYERRAIPPDGGAQYRDSRGGGVRESGGEGTPPSHDRGDHRDRSAGDRRPVASGAGHERVPPAAAAAGGPMERGSDYRDKSHPASSSAPPSHEKAHTSHPHNVPPPQYASKSSSAPHTPQHPVRTKSKTPSPLTTASERTTAKDRQSPQSSKVADKADQVRKQERPRAANAASRPRRS